MTKRSMKMNRKTSETDIEISLNIDGNGKSDVNSTLMLKLKVI